VRLLKAREGMKNFMDQQMMLNCLILMNLSERLKGCNCGLKKFTDSIKKRSGENLINLIIIMTMKAHYFYTRSVPNLISF
jgi:hypothetical protein